jgi:hypothetical protein
MIPIVYSISTGKVSAIHFDSHQKVEIFLTIAQSALGMILLVNMEFRWYEALGLFSLWFIQFVIPTLREEITWVYLFWLYVELILAFVGKRKLTAFKEFRELVRKHF